MTALTTHPANWRNELPLESAYRLDHAVWNTCPVKESSFVNMPSRVDQQAVCDPLVWCSGKLCSDTKQGVMTNKKIVINLSHQPSRRNCAVLLLVLVGYEPAEQQPLYNQHPHPSWLHHPMSTRLTILIKSHYQPSLMHCVEPVLVHSPYEVLSIIFNLSSQTVPSND